MESLLEIPEITCLDSRSSIIRIPPEVDVPFTHRVRCVVDTPQFQHLGRISQLGLVRLIYPGAVHSRAEHSLGVLRLASILLKRMAHDPRFLAVVSPRHAELFLLTALLHDIGHWPFCHPAEDMGLEFLSHESLASRILVNSELGDVILKHWSLNPEDVARLLCGKTLDEGENLLYSMLSGPVDVDKMDYLQRDSLHAGVPYGRNYDLERLLGSLCLNALGNGLAISSKGKTAAELMVFARYVMFSEVYWHHAVRSATAMFQRIIYASVKKIGVENIQNSLFSLGEWDMIHALESILSELPEKILWDGLFGTRRNLYKQAVTFSCYEFPDVYKYVARRKYSWLVKCADRLALLLTSHLKKEVMPHQVIIDAPPPEREVEFKIDIYYPKENRYRHFHDVSPVIRALALEQFDDSVKRVRVFLPDHLVNCLPDTSVLERLLIQAAQE